MEEIIIPAIAGILAGLGTGFAGLSAAVFISPMLVVFLGMDSFTAIGIALASDVLASAISAFTYKKHGNTELKKCLPLMLTVFVFAILGSVISHIFTGLEFGESVMSWWLVIATFILGIKLLFFPAKSEKKNRLLPIPDIWIMILGGAYIGFVCGFQGTGGGLMLLFVLNILLRIDFKKSVGTSVFIMSVTAFIGMVSHFTLRGMPDIPTLVLCVLFTLAGAEVAAVIANKISPVLLKRITGALMTVSTVAMIIVKI